jgi:hypothetical protein
MTRDDEFRKQAADAQKQAQSSISDIDREAWLRVAQGWLSLIRNRPQNAADKFETESTAIKTTDEDSNTSH